MTPANDISRVVEAAGQLDIRPRSARWAHLPLCVLDAVFSINANYTGVINVCRRYGDHTGLPDNERLLHPDALRTVAGTAREQPVNALAELGSQHGAEGLAKLLNNRGRTSTRKGIRKAEAATRYAEVLSTAGIGRLQDVAALLDAPERLATVESALRRVPGHGQAARLSYLWMLAGSDDNVKPDRMILRWLRQHVGHAVTVPQAHDLVTTAAARLRHTPWELDHAIWRRESGRG